MHPAPASKYRDRPRAKYIPMGYVRGIDPAVAAVNVVENYRGERHAALEITIRPGFRPNTIILARAQLQDLVRRLQSALGEL
jgi:hypothetical protein